MERPLKEQLVLVTMRFKRIDICPSATAGLQPSELAILAHASNGCACGGKGLNVTDLQQNLHISKPAVSQTLNNLEKRGYIVRAIDTEDRRKITVLPTPAGEKVLAKAQRHYEDSLELILEQLGSENIQTLVSLMNRLMELLEDD